MNRQSGLVMLFFLVLLTSSVASANPLEEWTQILPALTPIGSTQQLNNMFCGGGDCYAVTRKESPGFMVPFETYLYRAAYTSASWTDLQFSSAVYDGVYGDGKIVLVGSHGSYSSTDSVVWKECNWDIVGNCLWTHDVKFVPATRKFIQYESYIQNSVQHITYAISDDGDRWATWWPLKNIDKTWLGEMVGVVFGKGTYVVALPHSILAVLTEGRQEQEVVRRTSFPSELTITDLAYGNGVFVAIAERKSSPNTQPSEFLVLTSADGVIWTEHLTGSGRDPLVGFHLSKVAYGGGTFVALGEEMYQGCTEASPLILCGNLARYSFYSSENGNDWHSFKEHQKMHIESLSYVDGTFLAWNSYGEVWRSGYAYGNCSASLEADLSIRIPYFTIAGQPYWLVFSYIPNTVNFALTNAGIVENTQSYEVCQPATLDAAMTLHVPYLVIGNASYWLDLVYSNEGSLFRYSSLGMNP